MAIIHSQDFWAILISTARGGPEVALGVGGNRERESKKLRSNFQALFSSTKVLTLHLLYIQDFMNKPPANRSLKSTSQHHPFFFDAMAQRSANSIPWAKSNLLPVFVGSVSQEWFLPFRWWKPKTKNKTKQNQKKNNILSHMKIRWNSNFHAHK